ncbi:MAG: hypothetical protein RIR26_2728 [Pseudomonadota bacterium]
MADWEVVFRGWASPLSETEQAKCDNAERMIREAIRNHSGLADLDVVVFPQGSYRANTNVRQDSDVDICVCCTKYFYADYTHGITPASVGISESGLSYAAFKNMVGEALAKKFGKGGVTRGNKAFDVHENSYRIDADVVPTFEHRRYFRNAGGAIDYVAGVEFRPDGGGAVINWPEQTHRNGVERNIATGRRYKSVIRILKRLRNRMQAEGKVEANNIASFLIECLVWNVPSEKFGHERIVDDVKEVLSHAWFHTYAAERSHEWGEVNELKYLFRNAQPWSVHKAENFLWAARSYLGFI